VTDVHTAASLEVFFHLNRSRSVNVGGGFSHGFSLQRYPVGIVQEAVEDGGGKDGFADVIVPVVDRELTGNQGGAQTIAILDDFHQVVALACGQFLDSPIDELGYLTLKPEQVNAFFKLLDMRYRKVPTIITTNLIYADWYPLFQRKDLVDALLDRLQHHCITIQIDGPSLRTQDPATPSPRKQHKITQNKEGPAYNT
jgi:IstB-like ATP binding protein